MTDQLLGLDSSPFKYDEAMLQTRQLIAEILQKSPLVIRQYTAYLAESSGKMLRAASVLICAQDDDLNIPVSAVQMAAAIELVHLATLVHDDVIDNADLRRGKPTLRKAFGNKTAVICGDYLLSKSLRLVSALPDPGKYLDRKFHDYISYLCLGELNQLVNNSNFNLTPLQYFRIINGKTAALFEASFLAGAVTGELSDSDLKKYSRLGHIIGMIFQLTDDCLDFEADLSVAGKNVQTDYEQNVVTLPLVFALKADPAFKNDIAAAESRGEKMPRSVINQLVIKDRGLFKTHQIVHDYGNKAQHLLDQLVMPAKKRADLELLLKKAMRSAS